MRSIFAAYLSLAILGGMGTADAAGCPAGALGVGRTLVVDPNEHVRLGGMHYGESLPLKDGEVVLTFDDGPLPPYTDRILDTLASECVKATFFMVGRMARANPGLVQRVSNEGHTVASHTQNHPFGFDKMSVDEAAREIEDGFGSTRSVLEDSGAVAPFFRAPGLRRQDPVEQYLAAHGYMTWSADFVADDWTGISSQEIARRAIQRVVSRGKGILLLHDIQPATALAFPQILHELKARGFKIVHVVPATAARPKTVTDPQQWVVRRMPEQKVWPRALVATVNVAEPALSAPSPANFGIERSGAGVIKLALAQSFGRQVVRDDGMPSPPAVAWPTGVAYSVADEIDVLPVPGAQNFRYSRPPRTGFPETLKVAARKPPVVRPYPMPLGFLFPPQQRPHWAGYQFRVARPPVQLNRARPQEQSTGTRSPIQLNGARPQDQSNLPRPPSDVHSAQAR